MLFDENFEVFLANTEESKKLHYALRYQVYCQETQFEDSSQFCNQLEIDDLDRMSVHFIVKSKKTNEWLGAIRLIVSALDQLPAYGLLQKKSFYRQRMAEEVNRSQAQRAVEISRLCILGCYRKTGASLSKPNSGMRSGDKAITLRQQPEILLGLIRVAYTYCVNHQIDICLFTVTKSLAKIMQRLSLSFIQAGEEVEHRGLRAPYYTYIPSFLGNIHLKSQVAYDMFMREGYSLYNSGVSENKYLHRRGMI